MYGCPVLSFMDYSSLLRLDDTVERVEVVQGGPGAVFGPAQMGATANFILRPRHRNAERRYWRHLGKLKAWSASTASTASKSPTAGTAAPAAFTAQSDGVRNPQFPADQGGQFTATLSTIWMAVR